MIEGHIKRLIEKYPQLANELYGILGELDGIELQLEGEQVDIKFEVDK